MINRKSLSGAERAHLNVVLAGGDTGAKRQLLQQLVQAYPDDDQLRGLFGNVLSTIGQWEEAERQFCVAAKLNPRNAAALIQRGFVLLQLQRASAALECFLQAEPLSPADPLRSNGAGVACMNLGDPKAAELHFRRCLKLRPNQPSALQNLALALGKQARFEEAEAALRHAVSLVPNDVLATLNLAVILERQGKLNDATNKFEQCRGLGDRNARLTLLEGLARCLFRLGRLDETCACLEEILREDPANEGAMSSLLVLLTYQGGREAEMAHVARQFGRTVANRTLAAAS